MENILDYCTISGESVKKFEGIKKYIATGDIINNKIINYSEVDYRTKQSRANQIAKEGEVIFAKMKDTKKVMKIDKENSEYIYSTGFYIIKPNEGILTDYIYWLFNSTKFNRDKDKHCKGATQKALNSEGLRKIKINKIPNLEEQQKIVSKLSKIDKIMNKKKKQLMMLDDLIKSQFVEMFETIKRYVELQKVCLFINGDRGENYPSGDKISKNKDGIAFINAGLLERNKVNWSNMNYISEDTYNNLRSGKIQKDDILYCLRGSLGKCAIIDFSERGAIASSLVILRANKNEINPNFLLIQLGMEEILYQQNQANNGSSQPNLSANSVKKYKILLPPLSLQNEFSEIVKQIDKQKFESMIQLEMMEKIYNIINDRSRYV